MYKETVTSGDEGDTPIHTVVALSIAYSPQLWTQWAFYKWGEKEDR